MLPTSQHSRINRTDSRLVAALTLSLALHLLPALSDLILPPSRPSTAKPPALLAELRPPTPPAPELILKTPETPPPAPVEKAPPPAEKKPPPPPLRKAPPPAKPVAKAPVTWSQVVKQHLQKLAAAGQFYPAAAIAGRQQGVVEVLMFLDENGKVAAARIERGSGYPLLDNAALQAVRSLTSLPADAPRQVVLPVRFRLH